MDIANGRKDLIGPPSGAVQSSGVEGGGLIPWTIVKHLESWSSSKRSVEERNDDKVWG